MSNNIYAIIFENVVKNVIICDDYTLANALARASFGDNAFAVESSRYAVGIGDLYENGIFYRILRMVQKFRLDIFLRKENCLKSLMIK